MLRENDGGVEYFVCESCGHAEPTGMVLPQPTIENPPFDAHAAFQKMREAVQ